MIVNQHKNYVIFNFEIDITMETLTAFTESIDNFRIELEKKWQDIERSDNLNKQKKVELLYVFINLIESFGKKAYSIGNDIELIEINKGWPQLRNIAERMQRRIIVLQPPSKEEFEATLMWMAEKGEKDELNLIKKVKSEIIHDSESTQELIEIAIQKIQERVNKQERRLKLYQVLCDQNHLEQRFPDIQIIEYHSNYSIILASQEIIKDIEKVFIVDKLNLNRALKMTDKRNWVLQFNTPVVQVLRQRIKETGAKILQPLSRLEIVVSIPSEEIANQIRDFEEVVEVTPYVPKISVKPQYLQNLGQPATKETIAAARLNAARNRLSFQNQNITLPGILIANFFTPEDRDRAAENLEPRGIRIANKPGKTKLVIDLSSDSNALESLKTITEQTGLQSLGEKTIPKLLNNKASQVIATGINPSNPAHNLGLTGKGEIVAITDSGLDTGEPETLHVDFRERVNWINSYPIQPSLSPYVLNPSANDGASDIYSGHGTHVAGSALGSGEQAKELELSSIPQGIASEAELVFQAVEQTPQWNLDGQLLWLAMYQKNPPKSGLFGIPDDLEELFEDAYDKKARIHSNSWGGGEPGVYDQQSQSLDQFVWDHKDFLVLVAAGNDGKQSSSATKAVDQGSVTAPGTAKNCLTVGASENNRNGEFPDTYENWWPDKFPYAPFNSDGMVDSIDHIAAFSSRGPCEDNRRKPDVIAPGTFILSTRSSQIPGNNFGWGAYPPAKDYYMYMGGTSMATPLVAGCAALVRQYLKEKHQPSIDEPSAALIKAILIHSAQYIKYRFAHPDSAPWADNEQGWGRVDLQQVLNPAETTQVLFIDEGNGLKEEENREYPIEITDSSVPLRTTLVYTDYPGEKLINNLNLVLHSPSGKDYLGNDFQETGERDTVNNVEGVVIKSPEIGIWTVEILAEVIGSGFVSDIDEQDYALVISGGGLKLI